MNPTHTVILFYKYVTIKDPKALVETQRDLCVRLNLKGRTLIAHEGINGTLEGTNESIEDYCEIMKNNPLFSDIQFKKSAGDGTAFLKLFVRAREEIVTSSLGGLKKVENRITGKYLKPEELHEWIQRDREFYIVDMRNDYEQKVGHFENSIFPGMNHFRDLPKIIPNIKHLKNKTVITVCTGGVRCERASGFLIEHGFSDIYQLEGGIVTYMEKYPNQDFKGKLYVFDRRIVMGFNTEDPTHKIIGVCEFCNTHSEQFINCAFDDCHRHFICCEKCHVEDLVFCNEICKEQKLQLV